MTSATGMAHKVLKHYDSHKAMLTTINRHTTAGPHQPPSPTPPPPPPSNTNYTHLDWSPSELRTALNNSLSYTLRSSKYPRTLTHPQRILLSITPTNHPTPNEPSQQTHTFTPHLILLTTFSKRLSTLLSSQPTLTKIDIRAINPIGNISSWHIFTEWLYTLDKAPLQDYTPLRPRHWRTSDMKDALFLASWLSAPKFEKYLLRIMCLEIWEDLFPPSDIPLSSLTHDRRTSRPHPRTGKSQRIWHPHDLRHLNACMPSSTGSYHFLTAYHKWHDAGFPGELDPYTWRVEHWYSICGTVSNWGCFHTMNPTGWGAVWERQRALWGTKVGAVGEVRGVRGGRGRGRGVRGGRGGMRGVMGGVRMGMGTGMGGLGYGGRVGHGGKGGEVDMEMEEWMDEILYDDPPEGDAFWGNDACAVGGGDGVWGGFDDFGGDVGEFGGDDDAEEVQLADLLGEQDFGLDLEAGDAWGADGFEDEIGDCGFIV